MKRVLLAGIAALIVGVGIVVLTGTDKDQQSSSTGTNTDMSGMDMPTTNNQPANPSSNSSSESAQTSTVAIKDFAYSPSNITVKKGTTVTWTNQDAVGHDVTPDNPTDGFKQSEMLSKGESYSVTFNMVGTFTYFCSPHPYMKAQVIVIE